MNGIEVVNLSKSFGDKPVLRNVSFKLGFGENLAIMGESGCGKTTLINILCGLVKQDNGEISGLKDKIISIVFQENRLVDSLTVFRNLKIVCPDISKEKAISVLNELGLERKVINAKVNTLSGGMKRRIAIARALIFDADIYIFDEPAKGLDEDNKLKTIEYILKVTKDKSVLYITHDKSEADMVSDTILYL